MCRPAFHHRWQIRPVKNTSSISRALTKGQIWAYYFDLRRRGFAPNAARNCAATYAAATTLHIPDTEACHLSEFYARPGHYTGD